MQSKRKNVDKRKIFLWCAAAGIVLCAVLFCLWHNRTALAEQRVERALSVTVSQPEPRLAQEDNTETGAWITVPGTNIDAPVQQASDNDYYLRRDTAGNADVHGCVFADYNAKKQALSRYGVTYILKKYAAKASPVLEPQNISPHVLRHTKAMHLLRAGVNMIYIRDFLGHADISTTEVYARIDAEMKRKVFEEKVPNYTPNTTMPWEEDEDLLQWLTQFGKKTF